MVSILYSLLSAISFIITIGLFFGLNYGEIKVTRHHSVVSTCVFDDAQVTLGYGTSRSCFGCRNAPYNSPRCSTVIDDMHNTDPEEVELFPTDCDNGRYYCDEDRYVNHHHCMIYPHYVYYSTFYGNITEPKTGSIVVKEYYGKNQDKAANRLDEVPLNVNVTYYSNPKDYTDVVLDLTHTNGYWAATAIFLFLTLLFLSLFIYFYVYDNTTNIRYQGSFSIERKRYTTHKKIAVVGFIWFIFVPCCILLPLLSSALISDGSKTLIQILSLILIAIYILFILIFYMRDSTIFNTITTRHAEMFPGHDRFSFFNIYEPSKPTVSITTTIGTRNNINNNGENGDNTERTKLVNNSNNPPRYSQIYNE